MDSLYSIKFVSGILYFGCPKVTVIKVIIYQVGRIWIFFLLSNTRLVQQSFEASMKQQAGCNQTCMALIPLPSSIPGISTRNLSIVSRLWYRLDHSFCLREINKSVSLEIINSFHENWWEVKCRREASNDSIIARYLIFYSKHDVCAISNLKQ